MSLFLYFCVVLKNRRLQLYHNWETEMDFKDYQIFFGIRHHQDSYTTLPRTDPDLTHNQTPLLSSLTPPAGPSESLSLNHKTPCTHSLLWTFFHPSCCNWNLIDQDQWVWCLHYRPLSGRFLFLWPGISLHHMISHMIFHMFFLLTLFEDLLNLGSTFLSI